MFRGLKLPAIASTKIMINHSPTHEIAYDLIAQSNGFQRKSFGVMIEEFWLEAGFRTAFLCYSWRFAINLAIWNSLVCRLRIFNSFKRLKWRLKFRLIDVMRQKLINAQSMTQRSLSAMPRLTLQIDSINRSSRAISWAIQNWDHKITFCLFLQSIALDLWTTNAITFLSWTMPYVSTDLFLPAGSFVSFSRIPSGQMWRSSQTKRFSRFAVINFFPESIISYER